MILDLLHFKRHACGLQPYYYHDVRGDETMQKSQRITTSCDLWDNCPESNSKPRVDVALKSNFWDSSHFFCDPMTQGGTYASPRLAYYRLWELLISFRFSRNDDKKETNRMLFIYILKFLIKYSFCFSNVEKPK